MTPKSEKKRPTSIIPGDESRRWREGAQGRRDRPLVGVDDEHLLDQIFGVVRDLVPVLGVEGVVRRLDLAVQDGVVVVVEGRVAPQQDINYHSARPHVDGRAVLLSFEDLRSHIAGRTTLGI